MLCRIARALLMLTLPPAPIPCLQCLTCRQTGGDQCYKCLTDGTGACEQCWPRWAVDTSEWQGLGWPGGKAVAAGPLQRSGIMQAAPDFSMSGQLVSCPAPAASLPHTPTFAPMPVCFRHRQVRLLRHRWRRR